MVIISYAKQHLNTTNPSEVPSGIICIIFQQSNYTIQGDIQKIVLLKQQLYGF